MARKCAISGIRHQCGNNVSHAKNRSTRTFGANIQLRKIFVPELNKNIRIKVATKVLRTIDKIGFNNTLKKYNLTIKDIT